MESSNEEIWYKNFNELKEYINLNGKLPCQKTSLGMWLNMQKQNYKSNKYIMRNETIRNEWEKFINDDKYKDLFKNIIKICL